MNPATPEEAQVEHRGSEETHAEAHRVAWPAASCPPGSAACQNCITQAVSVVRNIAAIAFTTREGAILYASPRLCQALGQDEHSIGNMSLWALLNVRPIDVLPTQAPDGTNAYGPVDVVFSSRNGVEKNGRLSGVVEHCKGSPIVISVLEDLTEWRLTQDRIKYLSHHDELTGLPNRMHLQGRLEQSIANARGRQHKLSVLSIGLDRFRSVNETLGHQAGDKLLAALAQRLRTHVQDRDIVARLNGDEFLVILSDMDYNVGRDVAEKLLAQLSTSIQIDGRPIQPGACIGISQYPEDGHDDQTLIRHANVAMANAKAHGRNIIRKYHPDMSAESTNRLLIESQLGNALANNQFVLDYQPQIDARTGKPVSMEALIRWRHPEHGLLGPDKFIPVAEESGKIIEIGRWVLTQALEQLRQWRHAGHTNLSVSVNLSANQLQDQEFPLYVALTLGNTGLPGDALELEITETAAMGEPGKSVAFMKQLRDMGVALSLDDFGRGFSSMSYIKRLPINRIKIDREFVRDVERDYADAAICSATVSLARDMFIKVVAEGVEQQVQADILRHMGCDYLQGYLISHPMPADAASFWLAQTLT